MKRARGVRIFGVILCAAFAGVACQDVSAQVGSEVGNFPNASALTGSERFLADQSATTVNITPVQIAQYLGIPNGLTFPLAIALGGTGAGTAAQAVTNLLPTFVTGDCLSNTGTVLLWSACGSGGAAFQVNGTALASATTVNFESSLTTNGLTLTFSNPSTGNVQLGLSGSLTVPGGGTGATTLTQYSILAGDGTAAVDLIAPSATSGYPLLSQGSAAFPIFQALNLASAVTGLLPPANGGTGASTLAAAALPVFTGTIIAGDCVEWATTTSIKDAGVGCTAGISTVFQVNGTATTASSPINFESSVATGGLTLTFANPSAGNVQLGLSGWPASLVSGDCLTNNGSVISWGSCAGTAAVTSVTAGSSGSVSVSPTTGAVIVDLAATATGTVLGNISGSSAAPSAVSMTSLAAALVSANENLISVSAPTGPTNDWSPTGWGTTVAVIYATPASGGSTLDGLVAGSNMQQVFIVNAEAAGGSDDIVLMNQSASDSTAANRFLAAGTLAIPPGGGVACIYFGGAITRWWCH